MGWVSLNAQERAMAGIAAKRQRYIDAHLREFSPRPALQESPCSMCRGESIKEAPDCEQLQCFASGEWKVMHIQMGHDFQLGVGSLAALLYPGLP